MPVSADVPEPIPGTLQVGQPMTLKLQVNKTATSASWSRTSRWSGPRPGSPITASRSPSLRRARRLEPLLARGKPARGPPAGARRRCRSPDRLAAVLAGENFWSGDEIWGFLPEIETAFVKTDNVEFTRYINDRTRAPLGRRYFLITEAGRITSARASLPTQRARETYEVIDTTSNKFSIAAFGCDRAGQK